MGQTHVAEDTDAKTFKVTMLLSLPARSEATTVDVRHILLTADRYGSDDKAKAKAEELLDEWKNGDATEESFAELAGAWSEDGGSSLNGGLYTYVTEGSMVEAFNDWCFDSSRKAGGHGHCENGLWLPHYVLCRPHHAPVGSNRLHCFAEQRL